MKALFFHGPLMAALSLSLVGGVMAAEAWDETIRSQERQIEALQSHVDLLQQQREERRVQMNLLADLREEVLQMGLEVEVLRGQVLKVQSSSHEMTEEFEKYRERYRLSARIEAVGEELPELTTASGKSYQDVTIKKVTDAGMVIWHRNGTTRVVFNDLPRQMRDRFQWDEQQAVAHLEEESERETRRDEYLARQMRRETEKRQQQAEKATIDRRIASLEQQLRAQRTASTRSSPLATSGRLGATRSFGSGSIYRSRPHYDDRSYYRNRYYSRSYRPTVTYYSIRGSSSCRPTTRYPVSRPSSSLRPPTPGPPRRPKPVSTVSPTITPR